MIFQMSMRYAGLAHKDGLMAYLTPAFITSPSMVIGTYKGHISCITASLLAAYTVPGNHMVTSSTRCQATGERRKTFPSHVQTNMICCSPNRHLVSINIRG